MKLFQIVLVVLMFLVNLVIACPSWAERPPDLISNADYFEVGQKVTWLYKPRADSADVQRIPAEIVKLGSKQVQIKVYRPNKEVINRWVNRNRLESLDKLKKSVP
ncbi:hypothetical protein I8748_12755 [Nostoc sp. CENA67]|uniref:Uncharacterized protein n=1 Tax=Amazonocrinis nigriterrae CENA67 TaxID=2794033 RepID=A0A8J7HS39_9NOST|nr:hypothetical protein [Amazonocrinis nigriterrae]MBH8563040.1 hypothetical protein [Amazonocrinis nigriterrae CENA67]